LCNDAWHRANGAALPSHAASFLVPGTGRTSATLVAGLLGHSCGDLRRRDAFGVERDSLIDLSEGATRLCPGCRQAEGEQASIGSS
jgi:hypothetical protein